MINDEYKKNMAKIIKKTDRENANVGTGPSAKLLQIAENRGREFMVKELTCPDVLAAINENIIYPHDYSWGAIGTTTCTFIPLAKLLKKGFNSGHGLIRSPKRIRTAAQLACIIIQSNQNDQHGGQAFGWFDRDMVPYVQKEFNWQLNSLKKALSKLTSVDISEEEIIGIAKEKTEEETMQAMEGLVFNSNTMHSRAGAQIPFATINIGTDTSEEGRLICKTLLLAYEKGLGNGEQPIFPNLVFKVKEGINFFPQDPNYDLFQLAIRVTSTRLFPNYVFQDASFNRDFPTDIPMMGCRTRVSWNVNKPDNEQTCEGRGNLSFTTINLPGVALKAVYNQGDEESYLALKKKANLDLLHETSALKTFFVLLDKYTDLIFKQLFDRYIYQCNFTKKDFPFLLGGVWMDSENITNGLEKALRHGTLTLGFIGLAEALKCLTGKHHGEDEAANVLGQEIIKFLRFKTDVATKQYNLNYSLLATPAEGLTGKLVEKDKEIYGEIAGVTDKEWYTNSYHIPVEYPISCFSKIAIEGPYHKYCNAGHISYVELESAPSHNTEAIFAILKHMKNSDMGYVAINFPIDRCRKCGMRGLIESACSSCGGDDISRIRRITGYLAELDMFNEAKKKETLNRTIHLN